MDGGQLTFLGFVTSPLELNMERNLQSGDHDAMAILLLVLLLKILAIGGIFFLMAIQVIRQRRKANATIPNEKTLYDSWHGKDEMNRHSSPKNQDQGLALTPPKAWMAIQSSRLINVEDTFGIKECQKIDWDPSDCLHQDEKIFIAPPVRGWTLVFGEPLKTRYTDIDELFHFIKRISESYGTVQYFSVDPVTGYHCWINSHDGKFLRSYVWDGETIWNQGTATQAEKKLNLMTLDYFESPPENEEISFVRLHPDIHKNIDQIYALSGLWGVNPLSVDTSQWGFQKGILGSV